MKLVCAKFVRNKFCVSPFLLKIYQFLNLEERLSILTLWNFIGNSLYYSKLSRIKSVLEN